MDDTLLVVAPHYDDETLGCGGTVVRMRRSGARVHVVWCTDGGSHGPTRREEAAQATAPWGPASTRHLDFAELRLAENMGQLARALALAFVQIRPRLVLCPQLDDDHPDHEACARATLLAARLAAIDRTDRWSVGALLGYEVWRPIREVGRLHDISSTFDAKAQALACYRSQFSHRRIDEACLALNRYRGLLSGVAAAEAFSAITLTGPAQPAALSP